MVLVILFPLEDEKNVDVNQLFSGHVCLLARDEAKGAERKRERETKGGERGVIKMITHAATGCSKWDSASL